MLMRTLGRVALVAVMVGIVVGASGIADEMPFKEGQEPPVAEPGWAWCLVTKPATYKTVSEKVEASPATYYVERVPAEYEERDMTLVVEPERKVARYVPPVTKTVAERVMVEPESETYEVIPAQYEWAEKEVEVHEAYSEPVIHDAVYKTITEQVQLAPDRTQVVKVQCEDGYDCYTQVECPGKTITVAKKVLEKDYETTEKQVPAKTTTVRVRKLVKEAEVKRVSIPAKFETIQKTVVVEPGHYEYETVPAVTKTVKELVMIEPESTRRVEVAPVYETVTHRVIDQPAKKVWKKIRLSQCRDVAKVVNKYASFPCWTPPIEVASK